MDQLAKDLRSELPSLQGFSRINLYYIKKFYEYFGTFSHQEQIVPPPGGQMASSRFSPSVLVERSDGIAIELKKL